MPIIEEIEYTDRQIHLLDRLITEETISKVRRRYQNPDGSYSFEEVVRPTHPVDFARHPGEFAFKIHEQKPDLPLFPFYVSLRNLPADLYAEIAACIAEVTPQDIASLCTGIPQTGELIAQEFSRLTGIPYIKIFDKEQIASGRRIIPSKDAFKGTPQPQGVSLLVLDDVISHGDSHIEAHDAAALLGYTEITHAVLWDRQLKGREKLAKMGQQLIAPLNTIKSMFYYRFENMISEKQYNQAIESLNYL